MKKQELLKLIDAYKQEVNAHIETGVENLEQVIDEHSNLLNNNEIADIEDLIYDLNELCKKFA